MAGLWNSGFTITISGNAEAIKEHRSKIKLNKRSAFGNQERINTLWYVAKRTSNWTVVNMKKIGALFRGNGLNSVSSLGLKRQSRSK